MKKSPSKNKVTAAPKMIHCKLFGHKWDKYRGWDEIYPHFTAKCERCGVKYEKGM